MLNINRFMSLGLAATFGSALLAGGASASTLYSDDFSGGNNNNVPGWTELENDSNDVRVRSGSLRLRDALGGNPDAAAASTVIDASGFTNIVLTFDWGAFNSNETSDSLHVAWSLAPAPAMTNEGAWTEIAEFSANSFSLSSESLSLGPAADNAMFNLMFWSDVSQSAEGFVIDNLVNTGDAVAAVPLPAGLPLLAGAFGLLGLVRRRRADKTA